MEAASRTAIVHPTDPARCSLCGGSTTGAFTTTDRNRAISAARFAYRRCDACGTYSLGNVPDDLGDHYPAAYYELPDDAALAGLAHAEQHKVGLIRRHVAPGRLVEVGPGAGVFAYAAKQAGFDVTAIEMDERACTHVREVVGARAIHSDDPVAALGDQEPARAIALWHVIEHLPDPGATIDAAAAALEDGGVLAIATPNPESSQFRLLRGRWAHVDAPRHLYLLPLQALTDRAAKAGLRRAEVTTSDPAGRHWNRFGWEYALRRRPAANPPSKLVSAAALGVTVALRPLEHSDLRGAAYTAVFVKDGR